MYINCWTNKEVSGLPSMPPAISVCIPVYATERSLPACLQSVAAQRGLEACGGRDVASLEIIVVDDASPAADPELGSPARIVSQFQQESPWPVVFLRHEENRGLVEARRTAVEAATGEFIFCLDSDDTLPPAALATLYAVAEDADIVHGRAQVVLSQEGCQLEGAALETVLTRLQEKVDRVFIGRLEGAAILQNKLVEDQHNNFLWGKLIRRELYLHALSLIPEMYCTMAEDVVQYLLIAHGARRYLGISDIVYNYSVNTGISSRTKITSLERWEQVCSTASVFTVLFACLEELDPPFTESQLAAIRKLCRFYVANNLQQLHHAVVPELQAAAYEVLCDYWGAGLVKRMEAALEGDGVLLESNPF
ncbi:MAG: glycosyltransferase family 2 protein [Spirochaetaceae bacterium]|nr:glycosyltransferase family 2 protein [Spirochaetaceae bacterium]